MNPVARLDAGDRWRHFAVAACGAAVKSQHEVALYVERLRARRAPTQVPAYGHKNWLPTTRVREHIKVDFRRSSTSPHSVQWRDLKRAATAVSAATNVESRSFTKLRSRSPYYQRTCHAAIRPSAVAGVPALRSGGRGRDGSDGIGRRIGMGGQRSDTH
jgi:hypothetical protein